LIIEQMILGHIFQTRL